ncbi:MAG: hypothetical protein DHS20C12_23020 [Pseudohongiella sp.]|nr:MAG: hypothetical protein DHS20C12_23020 [Pseudohongiella sp.]
MSLTRLMANSFAGRAIHLTRFRTSSAVLLTGLFLSCSTEEPVSTSASSSAADSSSSNDAGIVLRTVSTQPWLVTGGDVLVEVALGATLDAAQLRLSLNGDDVSDRFRETASNTRQALITDMPQGDSSLVAELSGSQLSESLTLTNYPQSGPIISGPHEQPYVCQTAQFQTVAGDTLGNALDLNCTIPTRVDYVYWSDAEELFKPLPEAGGAELPEDMGLISVMGQVDQPYIVRVETGTVNRAIYEIAMLHNPINGSRFLDPFNRSPNWNNKLVYTHGGGCRAGWYQQGNTTGGVMRRGLFEQGYALTSATLNVFGQNCNDLLASETHIMVKERFIEHYGEPEYTIATGASGGSYQSHQTADNYPGVFDGIIVSSSFPDVTTATIFTLADSRLLHNYFTNVDVESFTQEQQRAVAGFGVWDSIANLSRGAARLDPIYNIDTPLEEQGGEISIPYLQDELYSETNTGGIRATVYDHTVNVYGSTYNPIDPSQTLAQRPLDNMGVQYGLQALNGEIITAQQFLDLNQGIGGFDRDMNHVPERHRADQQAGKRAIESGRVLYGGAGLASTPVIDYRSYNDHREGGDIHMIVHQFSTRQRMMNANGHADNHVMQVGGQWDFIEGADDLGNLFRQMDYWLRNIQADTVEADPALRVARNKPSSLSDSCWDTTGEAIELVEEPIQFASQSRCGQLYPSYQSPRHIAGAPLANDIVSCQLKPIDLADYRVSFTTEEYEQLLSVFPEGVCDWSQGDSSGARHQGTWKSFGPSPINSLY